jgi:hypothetical protein
MATSTPTNIFPAGIKPFPERKFPKTICMFDVDGTLSLARQAAKPEMQEALKKLRGLTAIAFLGGSDYVKIEEQLHVDGQNGEFGGGLSGSWARRGTLSLFVFKKGRGVLCGLKLRLSYVGACNSGIMGKGADNYNAQSSTTSITDSRKTV